jgi:hypothetical protein
MPPKGGAEGTPEEWLRRAKGNLALLRSPHPSPPGGDGQRPSRDVVRVLRVIVLARFNARIRNIFGFYAISRRESKAKSAEKCPLDSRAGLRALKDWSLDDKTKSSDG